MLINKSKLRVDFGPSMSGELLPETVETVNMTIYYLIFNLLLYGNFFQYSVLHMQYK